MNYEEAIAWIDGFHRFGIDLRLDRIEKVLHLLKDPHRQIRCIHVGGTNGKGSVCRYISSILVSEGYTTGLYLSPHLINFRERFQINNKFINTQRFVDIVRYIKPVIDEFVKTENRLTYFEVCTIIAFVFFAKEHIDYAIIEVGLGGLHDATNVITPLVSVITNVSIDHQKHLGNTIQQIASEKAGIIKPKIPVVTAATNEALTVIQKTCKKLSSHLTVITPDKINEKKSSVSHQTFLFHGFFTDYVVTTNQLGKYQLINVAVSIAVIETLQQHGVFVTKESIFNGIKKMNHPGRMQILQKRPFIVLDGAHNPEAMRTAMESINALFSFDRLIVIFGVMNDKAIGEMLAEIIPTCDIIIITQPNLDRAASAHEIFHIISKLDASIQIIQTVTVHEAYQKSLRIAKKNDLIFGTGSLFTVGELLQIYSKKITNIQ